MNLKDIPKFNKYKNHSNVFYFGNEEFLSFQFSQHQNERTKKYQTKTNPSHDLKS